MAVITISRDSYSRGAEVAEMVANSLGYECIGREMLFEASGQSGIPEIKLVQAMQDAPSLLDRATYVKHTKEKYVTNIQAALVRLVQKDNVVYYGLAGHFLLKGISHVLKVRLNADLEVRVKQKMLRENISYKKALRILRKDDEQRRKWSKYLYGMAARDPALYDLILPVGKISLDDAVNIICYTVSQKAFNTTPKSQKAMDDLVLACEVKALLIDLTSEIEVQSDGGNVYVKTVADMSMERKLTHDIKTIAEAVTGVNEVHVDVHYTGSLIERGEEL
jgi:cytidylate kinase